MNDTYVIKLIHLLSDGALYSNKQISKQLGIDCFLIDNYIAIAHSWGLKILSLFNNGYYIYKPLQLFNQNIINTYLRTGQLIILQVIDSTNQYLLDRTNLLQSGDVCLSEYQFKGRGKHGKSWISAFGNDLCCSIYWRFKKNTKITIINLSTILSMIIKRFLQNIGIKDLYIKWPNDLYLQGCKLAGILVEMVNKDNFLHVVIGIGINLFEHDYSSILNTQCINLEKAGIKIDRNIFAAAIINELRIKLQCFEQVVYIASTNYYQNNNNLSYQLINSVLN